MRRVLILAHAATLLALGAALFAHAAEVSARPMPGQWRAF